MSPELDKKLCDKYPKIFRDRHASMMETCMCWGFETGDGWYWLIDKLCEMLMWDPETGKHLEDPPVATQVKSKYGTLRFYVQSASDPQYAFISMAEHMSGTICESCGTTKDVFQTDGWVRTTCNACETNIR